MTTERKIIKTKVGLLELAEARRRAAAPASPSPGAAPTGCSIPGPRHTQLWQGHSVVAGSPDRATAATEGLLSCPIERTHPDGSRAAALREGAGR